MSGLAEHDSYRSIAELYDFVIPYRDRQDVAFFVDLARECGGRVLELGCGTGRILVPTARAGIDIVGLDLSSEMLDVCRDRLAQEPPEVRSRVDLVLGDMRSFDVPGRFSLATIPFRPFQHLLTVADQFACLACVRRHLSDNAQLVLDVFNPSIDALANMKVGEEQDAEPEFVMPDGRRVIRRHRLAATDRFAQVNQHELIYYVTYPDGRTERIVQAFGLRYSFKFEVEHLLVRAGFSVEHVYAGPDRSPYGSTYPGDLIFVARKTG
jgi:SAM-dependent methyltransferase